LSIANRRDWLSKCFRVQAPTKRPGFSQKQAIFSSSISRSISAKASEASDRIRSARSGAMPMVLPE